MALFCQPLETTMLRKDQVVQITSFGSKNVLHPHNEFLFWLVEGGILPIIGFLIMIIGFIKMTLKGGRQALALF